MLQRLALAPLGLMLLAVPALAQFGPQGPPAVGVIQAARRPVTESTEFVGRVEAPERVDLRARVTGFLQERLFREGQEVKRGDPLFRLERAPFEAELARTQATVASAEAELANARVSLSRAQELSRTGAGTRVTLDNAVAQERTASAQLLGAQAALRVSQINLGYTEIASPINGKIGRTNFTVGNVVGPDVGTLATIVSVDPVRISFPVSQRQVLELRDRYENRGGVNAVRVRVRLSNGQPFAQSGRVEFIDNQVDRNTDTLLIRALMPNPVRAGQDDRELVDGQFVNVFVEGIEPVQAITLPRAAVLQDQQGSYVFIVDAEKKAQRRNIRLGRTIGDQSVVEQGIEPGYTVITEGIQRVRPGQEVNAAPAAAPAAPQPGGQGAAPAPAQGGTAAPAQRSGTPGAAPAEGRSTSGQVPGAPQDAGGQTPAAPTVRPNPAPQGTSSGGRG
ncbi:efflux RND transporter periplasmic adaptor subunit [Roseomonas sp. BN140053]|uniref:efflux RND transporter periplasmic adaptor subunit n=1 Tax=Roseomonas sp. BN140053 TaxID=3391898 RepID=UPI0039EB5E61